MAPSDTAPDDDLIVHIIDDQAVNRELLEDLFDSVELSAWKKVIG